MDIPEEFYSNFQIKHFSNLDYVYINKYVNVGDMDSGNLTIRIRAHYHKGGPKLVKMRPNRDVVRY
jgi:hypothetical protein